RGIDAFRQRYPNHPQTRKVAEPPHSTVARLAGLLAAHRPARVGDNLAGIPRLPHIASKIADEIRIRGHSATTAIQLMAALGWFDRPERLDPRWAVIIDEVHARTGGPDLLTVQRMFDAVGVDGRALVWSAYSASWGFRIGRDWPNDHVSPFVAHNLDWILEESSSRAGWGVDEYALFAAVATLPRPPTRLGDRLYTLAGGPSQK